MTASSSDIQALHLSIRHVESAWAKAAANFEHEDIASLKSCSNDRRKILEEVLALVQAAEFACRQKGWKWKNKKGEFVIVRDTFVKMAIWIEKFKDIGDAIVQYDTAHAALPWGAARFVLQAAINDIQTNTAIFEGLELVFNLIARFEVVERLYLRRESSLKLPLYRSIVGLYTSVLEFLLGAGRYFKQKTGTRILKSVFLLEEITNKFTQDIKAKSTEVDDYIKLISGEILEGNETKINDAVEVMKALTLQGDQLERLLTDLGQPVHRIVSQMNAIDDYRKKESQGQDPSEVLKVPGVMSRNKSNSSSATDLMMVDTDPVQFVLGVERRRNIKGISGVMKFIASNTIRNIRDDILGESRNLASRSARSCDGHPILILPRVVKWLLQALDMSFFPLCCTLSTTVTVPFDSKIHIAITSGDVKKIRRLLCTSAASIYDADPAGFNLLYYATHYVWMSSGRELAIKLTKELLELGVDGSIHDPYGNRPSDILLGHALVAHAKASPTSAFSTTEAVDIANLLPNTTSRELWLEYLQETKWTFLHDILLHATATINLREYLSSIPADIREDLIDKPDRHMRTPLAWAVEHCWVESAKILLEYGANVNQMQYSLYGGFTPLLHLAIAGEGHIQDIIEITQLMIDGGADVNGADSEGWTPLHIAASWRQLDTIKLLDGIPDLNWYARTTDDKTALDLARDSNAVPNDDSFSDLEAFLLSRLTVNG